MKKKVCTGIKLTGYMHDSEGRQIVQHDNKFWVKVASAKPDPSHRPYAKLEPIFGGFKKVIVTNPHDKFDEFLRTSKQPF